MGPDTRRFTKSDTKQHIITYKDAMNAGKTMWQKRNYKMSQNKLLILYGWAKIPMSHTLKVQWQKTGIIHNNQHSECSSKWTLSTETHSLLSPPNYDGIDTMDRHLKQWVCCYIWSVIRGPSYSQQSTSWTQTIIGIYCFVIWTSGIKYEAAKVRLKEFINCAFPCNTALNPTGTLNSRTVALRTWGPGPCGPDWIFAKMAFGLPKPRKVPILRGDKALFGFCPFNTP